MFVFYPRWHLAFNETFQQLRIAFRQLQLPKWHELWIYLISIFYDLCRVYCLGFLSLNWFIGLRLGSWRGRLSIGRNCNVLIFCNNFWENRLSIFSVLLLEKCLHLICKESPCWFTNLCSQWGHLLGFLFGCLQLSLEYQYLYFFPCAPQFFWNQKLQVLTAS